VNGLIKFFKDDPLRALLFCAVIGIGYLYVDIRNMNADNLENCRAETNYQRNENNKLKDRIAKLEDLIDKL